MPVEASRTEDQIREEWKPRIEQARQAQKPYIPIWLSNLAFAAGQHWLVWDPQADGGRLRHIAELDPRYRGRNLLTADRINEYRQAQLGELASDDDRPQLLAAQQSDTAEEVAKQLNAAASYGWDHEWSADETLEQMRQYVIDMGTAAIRCRRDPDYGKTVDHQPFDKTGAPITPDTHPHDWEALKQTGQMADGGLPEFRPIREGRTVWEPYTAIQTLTPPGVNHEDRFPWEILVRPVAIEDVESEFPTLKGRLVEDTDIASAMGLTTSQIVRDQRSQGAASSNRLRGHVWVFTCFKRPCRNYPQGQVAVLVSNKHVVADVRDSFDYQLPNGDWHSGVVYFHWWRLNDRFYSRAFIEPLKDPQREINNLETFKAEIIARGGPKIFLQKPLKEAPTGAPVEVVVLGDQGAPPVFHQGIAPGDWMNIEKAGWIDNLTHASTLNPLRLGENPQNVDTYAQLALLNENESGKRTVIQKQHKRAIGTLLELSVWDIRRYWPEEKQILVSGDEDAISFETFSKSQIPDFYMARVPKGAAPPRTQGAEFKKIDAFWAAAAQSGLVTRDPDSWTAWYTESVNAGVAQEIPEPQADSQTRMAEFENFLMLHGEEPVPADYDLLPAHLPSHREAQDEARARGDMETFLRIQKHIDLSVLVQQENAARVGGSAQQPSPLGPPAPPAALAA